MDETNIKHFQTENRVIDHNTDLKIFYEAFVKDNLIRKLEEFQKKYSGFILFEFYS